MSKIKVYHLDRKLSDKDAGRLFKSKHIDSSHYDMIIDHDCDGYDKATGALLFKFRKAAMPLETLELGVNAFKDSIGLSANRGAAAGGRLKGKTMAKAVRSGNVGFMDRGGMHRFCRKTSFAREHFDEFESGIPFVQFIDDKYKELCPDNHAKQLAIAKGTNHNYVIGDTSFTTVTVNENFRTAVHKDGGDYSEGFGNLFVYRKGDWTQGYFTLPEWKVGIDMQNGDMLFVDVHRWHGNDEFVGLDPENGDLRISFVLYYREYMYKCESPSNELKRTKMKEGGYLKL